MRTVTDWEATPHLRFGKWYVWEINEDGKYTLVRCEAPEDSE